MKSSRVMIIGAGASGLAAAVEASRCGDQPFLLEALDRPGKKLLASGNGRCNLLNRNRPVYYGDPKFASSVLGEAPLSELLPFWNSLGLLIRYDAEGRGYPATFQASTVWDVLKSELSRRQVKILTGKRVKSVFRDAEGWCAVTEGGETFTADRLILSTGGAAQPKLGGNQSAVPWLVALGHHLVPFEPSLTSLVTDDKSVSGLAGIRVKCRISAVDGLNVLHSESGELLFTEKGISGICVMQCSRFIREGSSDCVINLLPDFFQDSEEAGREFRRRRLQFSEEAPTALMTGLCLPKLAYAVCKQAGIPLRGEKCADLSDDQLFRIVSVLHGYRVHVIRREGFEKAQAASGGLLCSEINPRNMESVLCPGLHVTGELLNVDGACGGYNLMFAVLSGIRAGNNGRNQHP